MAVDQVAEPAHGQVQAVDALGRGGLQYAAGLGRDDAARLAFDQGHAGLPFQPFDVLADGGLGAAEVAGDRAEAARPAHGYEHAKIFESHKLQANTGGW